jgi:hypothetical protein
MIEYIEREAALSAQNKSMNLSECRKRLERIRAADVRPVVTCGECMHRHDHRRQSCIGRHPDFFCADGEKREAQK